MYADCASSQMRMSSCNRQRRAGRRSRMKPMASTRCPCPNRPGRPLLQFPVIQMEGMHALPHFAVKDFRHDIGWNLRQGCHPSNRPPLNLREPRRQQQSRRERNSLNFQSAEDRTGLLEQLTRRQFVGINLRDPRRERVTG